MKNLLLIGFLFFGFSKLAWAVEVHGHRGARSVFPENTLPAFHYALDVGVDVLEFDLGVTKDNVVVVAHDPYINPDLCLGPKGEKLRKKILINSINWEDLKKYDCGALPNSRFPNQTLIPGTPIPSLEEVLQLVENHPSPQSQKVQFNIETKIKKSKPKDTVSPEVFVKLVLEVIEKYNVSDRTMIQSFDYRTLKITKRLAPHIRISALTDSPTEDLVATVQELNAEIISPYHKILTAKKVRELKAIGAKIAPWTANKPSEWTRLMSLGVDGIITDDPGKLLNFIDR